MAGRMSGQQSGVAHPFNSPIEVGMRSLILLTELHPGELDLESLAYFDYVLTYSADFDGPDNLHPSVPNRLAEYSMRREKLKKAIKLLVSKRFITPVLSDKGNFYKIDVKGSQFISCLSSPYYKKLWERTHWISDNISNLQNKKNNIYRMSV